MKPFQTIRALLCLTVCMGVLLWGCSREETPAAPSAPPAAPASKAEQMLGAMEKGSELLQQTEDVFGAPVLSACASLGGNGTLQEDVTLRRFSMMGVSYIGATPLHLETKKAFLEGVTYTEGVFSAEGEAILFESIRRQDGQYVSLPRVKDGNFALTDAQKPLAGFDLPHGGTDKLLASFGSLVTKDTVNVIHRDGGTEYTATLGEAAWASLKKAMDGCGLSHALGLDPLENSEGETCFFTVSVFSSPTQFAQKAVLQMGENQRLQTSYILQKKGNSLSLQLSVLQSGASLLKADYRFDARKGRMDVTGAMETETLLLESEITLTASESRKASAQGTVTATFRNGSYTDPLPVELTGEVVLQEQAVAYTLTLEASTPGMPEFSLESSSTFTPGTPEIPPVFADKELLEVDADGMVEHLRPTYPKSAALYDALFPGEDKTPEEVTSVTYCDQDGSLILSLYSDSTVGISLQGEFSMEEGVLALSYREHPLFSVPYTLNENNTCTIWNTVFSYYSDSTMDTYTYLSPGGANWIELMPILSSHGLALFDLCLPVTVTESALEIRMPDNSILSVPYTPREDGLSVMLWDLELKYAVSE